MCGKWVPNMTCTNSIKTFVEILCHTLVCSILGLFGMTKSRQEIVTNMTGCNLQVFSSSHFRRQAPTIIKYAKDRSGEGWNCLSWRLSCTLAEMTASTPFTDLFLATNLQGGDCHIYVIYYKCVFKTWRDKTHKNSNDSRPSDYLCCISFRNMNCAKWRNSCIGARPKSVSAEINSN